jgi:hypothetical protein
MARPPSRRRLFSARYDDLILAGVILASLPFSAVWALGLLLGINMIFGGVALIGMALHARQSDGGSTAPSR